MERQRKEREREREREEWYGVWRALTSHSRLFRILFPHFPSSTSHRLTSTPPWLLEKLYNEHVRVYLTRTFASSARISRLGVHVLLCARVHGYLWHGGLTCVSTVRPSAHRPLLQVHRQHDRWTNDEEHAHARSRKHACSKSLLASGAVADSFPEFLSSFFFLSPICRIWTIYPYSLPPRFILKNGLLFLFFFFFCQVSAIVNATMYIFFQI